MNPRRAHVLIFAIMGLTLAACSGGSGRRNPDASTTRDASADTSRRDATIDTGPGMSCASDAECDDGQMCTIDSCAVGGVCQHVPEDSFCATGERCDAVRGCTTEGCSVAAECDDGNFCNGAEKCLTSGAMGFCVMGDPVSCDDGNMCTVDTCDESLAGCTYALADGCDAGVPTTDAGPTAVPFDATMHYTGNFLVAPAPNLGCGTASYSFGNVVFSTTGSELHVQAHWIDLVQTPIPTGADFSVTANNPGCADYTLTGHFTDSNNFEGMWTAVTSGSCSGCRGQSLMIFGARSR